MKQSSVSFAVSPKDAALIQKIVARGLSAAKTAGRKDIKRMDAEMDITAIHANGCPLKLQEVLDADDFNFAHDFFGINRHICRDTGRLLNCFSPRFSAGLRKDR
jgi:hypothetical protein